MANWKAGTRSYKHSKTAVHNFFHTVACVFPFAIQNQLNSRKIHKLFMSTLILTGK